MNWIKDGINYVIDLSILQYLTWDALEVRACGKKEILTAQLKAITNYNSGEEDHELY